MADRDLSPDFRTALSSDGSDESRNLGDTNEDEKASEREKSIIDADHAVSKLAEALGHHARHAQLGETREVEPGFQEDEQVQLQTLLKPTPGKMKGVTKVVGRLLDYLGQRMMEGNPLTKKEMDAVSKFYLEQTAHVLGEYAYDDSEAKFKAPGLDGDEKAAAHHLANQVKHQMDRTDAKMHMHKMGVKSHHMDENWMSKMGGKGGKGDPLMNMGPPPRFDAVMQHLEECGRLADFVDQVEKTCATQHHPKPTLQHLELKEAKITSGVEELLAKVKQGKLFSAAKVRKGKSPRAQLRAELTAAASKEDDATIVENAGAIAQKHIKSTLKRGLALNPHKTEKKRAKRDHSKDIHVPVSVLKDHSTAELNKGLNDALALYGKRHKQKKTLSIQEHRKISEMLKKIAAHLMNKVEPQENEQEVHMLPQANIVSEERTDDKPDTPKRPVPKSKPAAAMHRKPTKPAAKPKAAAKPTKPAAKPKAAAPKPKPTVTAPAKPLVEGTAVKQFIWHTLGGQNQQPTPGMSLANLLKGGVRLFNGGKMFFDLAKP